MRVVLFDEFFEPRNCHGAIKATTIPAQNGQGSRCWGGQKSCVDVDQCEEAAAGGGGGISLLEESLVLPRGGRGSTGEA